MNMFGMGIFLTLIKYFSNPQQIMQESANSKTDLDFIRNRALSALILISFIFIFSFEDKVGVLQIMERTHRCNY